MSSFTLEQVQQHCKPDDVWIVLHNKVYDVTKYLDDHPGGRAVLLEVAGQDATEAFEEIGHSDEAREQLEPLYVGDLPAEEHAESIEVYRPNYEQVSQTTAINVKPSSSTLLPTLLKLGLAGAASTAAIAAYQQGYTLTHLAHALPTLAGSLSSPSHQSTSRQFWAGAGIASTLQFGLTLGLGMWASTKLDVQEEFTHYAPRRRTQAARLHRLPRSSSTALQRPKVLDARQWRSFPLAQKTEVAPNVYLLIFSLPQKDDILGLPTGQHVALRATSTTGQTITRSYTPISNNRDAGRIELLIKTYPNGAMTQHLAQMQPGQTIEMRGPKGAMQYSRRYAPHIGMIAGGTGITPMYQLIRAICEDPTDTTQVSLLYANNTEADILLRKELDAFAAAHPDKFRVRYVLARADDNWTGERGFVTAEMIERCLAPVAAENKVLLCGPPPMVGAVKGALGGLGWTLPGAVARAGDQVFLF